MATNIDVQSEIDAINEGQSYEKLSGWKGKLQEMNEKIVNVEKIALLVFLAVMCLTAVSMWILRAFFNIGYIWMGEVVKHTMMWSGFLGACVATSRLQHFRIDLVRLIHPENRNLSKISRFLSYFIAFAFCVLMTYATIKFITMLMEYNETDSYGMPSWPIYLVVLYFYVTSSVRFFLTALLKLM